MKAFLCGLLVLVALVVVYLLSTHSSCPPSGYERFSLMKDGQPREVGKEGLRGGAGFAPAEDLRSVTIGFRYDAYDRFLECGHAREKYPLAVNVVRFAVRDGFAFTPSDANVRADRAPPNWRELPIDQYSPADPSVPQHMLEGDPRFRKQAWFDFEEAGQSRQGRKHLVDSLGIEWLKDEPLDRAHLLGVWQAGWLFRSAKPGFYVWID
jgi:hypothetical protein